MSSRLRNERLLRLAGLVIGLACFGALVYYFFRAIAEGGVTFDRLRASPALIASVLLLASYAIHATAWHVLHAASAPDAKLAVDLARWALSLAGKYAPGKVFHGLARLYVYVGGGNAPGVASAFLTEALLSVTAAATLGLFATPWAHGVPLTVVAGLVAVVVTGSLALFGGLGPRLVSLVTRFASVSTPARIPVRALSAAFVLATLAYAVMACGLFALVNAIEPTPLHVLPLCIVALTAGGVAGVLAFFVPAGLGVREVTVAFVLAIAMPAPIATFAAVLSRLWLIGADAIAMVAGAGALRWLSGDSRIGSK